MTSFTAGDNDEMMILDNCNPRSSKVSFSTHEPSFYPSNAKTTSTFQPKEAPAITSMKLGDRVENSKKHVNFPAPRQLWIVSFTMFAWMVLSACGAFVVNDFVMRHRVESWRDYPEIPEQAEVEGSSSAVFLDTHPTESRMDPRHFLVYQALVVTVTIVQAGFGLELLIWTTFLKHGWSKDFENMWKFAQFFFPMLVTAAFGMSTRQEYMSMIFLVPGLWKFGLPETFMYMYSALYNHQHSFGRLGRVADFFSACGLVTHHSTAAFYISCLTVGTVQATPESTYPVLIVLIQHWFVLLQDAGAPNAYLAIELGLEIWFEWSVISHFHEVAMTHWAYALIASLFLLAHWFYLIAATLELIAGERTNKKAGIGNGVVNELSLHSRQTGSWKEDDSDYPDNFESFASFAVENHIDLEENSSEGPFADTKKLPKGQVAYSSTKKNAQGAFIATIDV